MKKNLNDPIIKRTMIAFGFNKIGDIASHFGKSRQNINGIIGRDTFINLIEPECYKRKINIDWIKTGQGEMMKPPHNPAPPDDLLSHVVKMQDVRLAQLQATVDGLNQKIVDLDTEIGKIKDRMLDTATTGDINRLLPTTIMRN